MGKYKVVKRMLRMRRAAADSFGLTQEALDPIGATIVEIDTSDEDEFIAQAKDAGIRAIKTAFEQANIDMPYPTQTVYLRQE